MTRARRRMLRALGHGCRPRLPISTSTRGSPSVAFGAGASFTRSTRAAMVAGAGLISDRPAPGGESPMDGGVDPWAWAETRGTSAAFKSSGGHPSNPAYWLGRLFGDEHGASGVVVNDRSRP